MLLLEGASAYRTVKLVVMLLWVFKQVRARLPWEEESGRRFSHSFLYKRFEFPSPCHHGRTCAARGSCGT